MKQLIPTSVGGGIMGLVIAKFLGRDYAIVAASVAGALCYLLVIYSIWPLLWVKRRPVLAPGLFGIALFSFILFTYAPINVALGRPDWFQEGVPFYVYIGSYGGLIGAVNVHLVQLGQTQGRVHEYVIFLIGFVAIGLSAAFIFWLCGR